MNLSYIVENTPKIIVHSLEHTCSYSKHICLFTLTLNIYIYVCVKSAQHLSFTDILVFWSFQIHPVISIAILKPFFSFYKRFVNSLLFLKMWIKYMCLRTCYPTPPCTTALKILQTAASLSPWLQHLQDWEVMGS